MSAAATTAPRALSVIVPVRDGAATIAACLEAALASDHPRFEVVVVDDASRDGTAELAARYPVKLVRLPRHAGVSRARNAGAAAATGELLVFIDADCLLLPGALAAADAAHGVGAARVLGGSYTPAPHDRDFFSAFQSAFIHHFETRRPAPDYVAAHAMAVDAELFRRSGGFVSRPDLGVAAGVEDVELSHRLRRQGCALVMCPEFLVRHVFRFSLRRSLANALRKARVWTAYSLANRDLLADSGTASRGLKANVVLAGLAAVLAAVAAGTGRPEPLAPAAALVAADVLANRGLVRAWRAARGRRFAVAATAYYLTLYAAAVAAGAALGAVSWLRTSRPPPKDVPCTPRSGTLDLSS
jgi:glycosyltransferase involved in cell wall biosynthesis